MLFPFNINVIQSTKFIYFIQVIDYNVYVERMITAHKDVKSNTSLVINATEKVGSGIESTVSSNTGILINRFGERVLPSELIIKHFKKRMGSLDNKESANQAFGIY